MSENRFGIKDFVVSLTIIMLVVLSYSIILLISRILFYVIGVVVVVSDLFSIFPVISVIPFVGQVVVALCQGISNITIGHKIKIYIGFGITLFLYFGLNINLIGLLIDSIKLLIVLF